MTRKFLLALTTVVVALTAAALPASAGLTMLQLTISPTTGDGETVVTFTPEDNCPIVNNSGATTNAPGDSYAAIALVEDPDPADFIADTVTGLDGSWSLTYTVPEDEPAGDITFYGFCLYENYPVDVTAAAVPDEAYTTAVYDPVVFTVTVPETTTTTSTSTTSTTTAPVPAPTLVATPTSVVQGGAIAVDAKGFEPGSNVVITLESDPVNLGTFVADSAGRIATSIVVPVDFPTGPHTLKLTGVDIAGSVLVLSTGITVASSIQVAPTTAPPAAVPAATGATLPQTGSSVQPALIVGAGLVLLGSVALVAARRRRSATAR